MFTMSRMKIVNGIKRHDISDNSQVLVTLKPQVSKLECAEV